jgi:hypothetical protein
MSSNGQEAGALCLPLGSAQPSAERARTGLLSVSDKTKLLELAQGLVAQGYKLIGSGGTAKAVRDSGIDIRSARRSPNEKVDLFTAETSLS